MYLYSSLPGRDKNDLEHTIWQPFGGGDCKFFFWGGGGNSPVGRQFAAVARLIIDRFLQQRRANAGSAALSALLTQQMNRLVYCRF